MEIGDRVGMRNFVVNAIIKKDKSFNKLPKYFRTRIHLLRFSGNLNATIIRIAKSGLLGLEFDKPIWTGDSRFNNGCNGRGKKYHCIYLPAQMVTKIYEK